MRDWFRNNKKRAFISIGLVTILLVLPLTLILVNIAQDLRGSAASPDNIETEQGVLSGSIQTLSDSLASGGQFVKFGSSQTASPTPNPNTSEGLASCSALDKGTGSLATPALQMPGYLQSTIDPVFGTKITRVSGNPGDEIPNGGGATWRNKGGSLYSKMTAWNADQSLLLMKGTSAGGHLFLNGDTYEVILFRGSLPNLSVGDTRWHPTIPNILVYVASDGSVGHWNPITNQIIEKFNPGSGHSNCKMGPWEGQVSLDGSKVVVNCGDNTSPDGYFFAVNLNTGTKYATIKNSDIGYDTLDWASISPSGNYIIASKHWLTHKTIAYSQSNFNIITTLGVADHFDMGIDINGNEVITTSNGTNAFMENILDGNRTIISSGIYSSGGDRHTSTRSINVPGWAYSTQNGTNSPVDGEILAWELKENGKIRRLTHHRTSGSSYDHYAYGVPSPDGKRVLYRSDWGNGSGPVYGFVVDTRNVCGS